MVFLKYLIENLHAEPNPGKSGDNLAGILYIMPKRDRPRAEQEKKLQDMDLIHALRYCGRDVVDIITGFLDDPNNEMVLFLVCMVTEK